MGRRRRGTDRGMWDSRAHVGGWGFADGAASAEAAAAETAAETHTLRAEAPAFSPPKPVELDEPMDAEAPASPRREQQRMLMEASEALASKAQAVPHHRPPVSETRPIRQFRRPNT